MRGGFNINNEKSASDLGVDEIIDVEDDIVDVDIDEITPAPPKLPERRRAPVSRGDVEEDELSQPFVNVHELFNMYNHKHFGGRITNTYVEYSSRMTLCAGTCTFKGPLGGCRIALSEPLLKFRPRSDLLSTLLHEMIHALLFVTEGVAVRDGYDGHGPKFMAHAERVNQAEQGKVNITPYHTFNDEVNVYRVHHWTCNRCSMVIKRAMNRAPAPRDPFWPSHQTKCGGNFIKTKEPEKKKKVLKRAPKRRAVAVDPSKKDNVELPAGVMQTRRIDSMLAGASSKKSSQAMVACPVCNVQVAKLELNEHLDKCLTPEIFSQDPTEVVCIPDSDDELHIDLPSPSRKEEQRPQQSKGTLSPPRPGKASRNDKTPNDGRRASISNSKRPRSDYDVLKEMIPDPDILMTLAVDPFSVNRDSVFSAFNIPAGSSSRKGEAESDDVTSILRPFIGRESPYELQQKAREQILRHVGKGKLAKEIVIHELAEQCGMDARSFSEALFSKAKRLKDGSYLISEETLRGIQSGRKGPPASTSTDPVDTIEIEESVPERGRPSSSDDLSTRRGSRNSKGTPADVQAATSDERRRNATPRGGIPKAGSERMENCPVCNVSVARSQLEEHVNICLNETDVAPLIFTGDDGSGADSASGRPVRKTSSGAGADGQPRCPLCDLGMAREELESHVQACMLSEGLEEVF